MRVKINYRGSKMVEGKCGKIIVSYDGKNVSIISSSGKEEVLNVIPGEILTISDSEFAHVIDNKDKKEWEFVSPFAENAIEIIKEKEEKKEEFDIFKGIRSLFESKPEAEEEKSSVEDLLDQLDEEENNNET